MSKKTSLQLSIMRILRSRNFFVAIMVLFALESLWIAISAAYPMVFDENTHLGLIKLHAAQWWNPVFLNQPSGGDFGGALTRDPSYFYHYIMSFPYLLLSHLTDSVMAQIIGLRLINIALFGTGLILFRKLLLKTKASPAIVNVTILFFVLIPVVPLLAGQINYDNLIMPLVAIALLMTTSINALLAKKQLPVGRILLLLSLCMFSCLVKFEFAPIFLAIVLWLCWTIFRGMRHNELKFGASLKTAWQLSNWKRKILVGFPLLVSALLFMQMYGLSTVIYHTPLPHCDQVISKQQCMAYAPYQRDQLAIAEKTNPNPNPVLFGATWVYRMFISTFYTSSGGASPAAWYLSINPLPVIFGAALLLFTIGSALLVVFRGSLFAGYNYLRFLLFVALIYCAMLFARNYLDYMVVGQKIAMNGRYLFPIALPVMLIFALAYNRLLGDKTRLKIALVTVAGILSLQGGGALSYLVASNENWYWQNSFVIDLNEHAKTVANHIVILKEPIEPITFTQR